jgi:hypothetical protein
VVAVDYLTGRMGAGASIPTQIDIDVFKDLSGDRFNQEIFDEVANENRTISKAILFDLAQRSDVFVSVCRSKMSLVPSSGIQHEGGSSISNGSMTPGREASHPNFSSVRGDSYLSPDNIMTNEFDLEIAARVNEALTEIGLITFFDSHETKMETQIRTAIDKTSLMLMFVSKNYINMLNAGFNGSATNASGSGDEEDSKSRTHSMANIYSASAQGGVHSHAHQHFKNMNQVTYLI